MLSDGIYSSRHCGHIQQTWSFVSNFNTLDLRFQSNENGKYLGFVAVWSATTEPPTYPLADCGNCEFPFEYGGNSFDTCIIIEDLDSQPWCPHYLIPPVDEGTHIDITHKISCSDSDSSCPSALPEMLITSPNYPLEYPNNFDQVI